MVFRITGGTSDPDSFESRLRYIVVFKLSRDPKVRLADDDLRRGINSPRGNYSLLNGRIELTDECCYPARFRRSSNCFMSYVGAFPPEHLRLLKRIPAGHELDVQLQPLTPSADGRPKLGHKVDRRVPMRVSDAKLRSSGARSALNRIGCR